ncbi:MAG: pyridoxamine 5'-phosphate oxidase family protein [Clostridiales bacterium]|nr:pyridoxamine 5'-phosphate oxidase family protein [Clostridiales bacterium]
MSAFSDIQILLNKQFGQDTTMSLATCVDNYVTVREIDAYYSKGSFYITTHEASTKMKQIVENPNVALCKGLFSATGIAINLGHPTSDTNKELRDELRKVFYKFYDNHVDENNPGTCFLKIDLSKAVAFDKENKYEIYFEKKM